MNIIILLICLLSQYAVEAQINRTKPQDYGVIIDAGSSGTRVRVYAWEEDTWFPGHDGDLPEITEIHNEKVKPGISNFAGKLIGLDTYITGLVEEAKGAIPVEKHRETRIYVFATAGMRLLMEDDANDVMFAINDVLLDPSINPFEYEALNTRILSGEEEGVFAWICVNYLRDFFTAYNGVQDVGLLEMGGASLQIAFRHDGSILADKFPVTIAGRIYPLYVHSYLGFGQAEIVERQRELAKVRGVEQNGQIINPCMIAGDNLTTTVGDLEIVKFLGTGDAEGCLEYMDEIVYEAPEDWCLPKPCGVGSVYQPNINADMPFYALSAFTYSLFSMDTVVGDVFEDETSYTIENVRQRATEYCAMPIATVEQTLDMVGSEYPSIYCISALYQTVLLEKGFKFSPTSAQLQAITEIDDQPIGWPLGALIYETERHLEECKEIVITSGTDSTWISSNIVLLMLNIVLYHVSC